MTFLNQKLIQQSRFPPGALDLAAIAAIDLQDCTRGTELWERARVAGLPFGIGPGAPNDVGRMESGLISYGADMRRQTHPANPFEMGFGKIMDLEGSHEFIGRDALLAMRLISDASPTGYLKRPR